MAPTGMINAKAARRGVFVDKFSTIEINAKISDFVFINAYSHVGHDCTIGTSSILGGGVMMCGVMRSVCACSCDRSQAS